MNYYWWGWRIRIAHSELQPLLDTGASAVNALASAKGWSSYVETVITLALAVIAAFDQGNGIYLVTTWAGVWWLTSA